MLFGVQHVVIDAEFAEQAGDKFGGFDGSGAEQYRLAFFLTGAHVFGDSVVFALLVKVDEVSVVLALYGAVGRDDNGFEAVDVLEFKGFGICSTGHACQLGVEAEEVLVGDRSERLRFLFDRHAFFDFDCLVQAVRPAAAFHGATGEFVNDDNFVVADNVVHIFVIEVVCA